jgi:hypothetical protein
MSVNQPGLELRLSQLARSSPVLMRALEAARAVDPPDWLIGSGVIRDLVWDRLHGRQPRAPNDVDLAFFDPVSVDEDRERQVHAALAAEAPDIPWDVTNQARVHLWYQEVFGIAVEPVCSCADGVATWPETATAVAVRLRSDEGIEVVAPYGLDDLFDLVCRRNPRRVTLVEYRRRTRTKRVAERWPKVTILDAS